MLLPGSGESRAEIGNPLQACPLFTDGLDSDRVRLPFPCYLYENVQKFVIVGSLPKRAGD